MNNPITKQLEEWKNEVREKAHYDEAEWGLEWSLDDVIESVEILVSQSNLDLLNTIESEVEKLKTEDNVEDTNLVRDYNAIYGQAINDVLKLLRDKLKEQ